MEVSVIIPIYNQERYLRDCLESVANQDCNVYEVILINDGSTDGSEKICLEYTQKYHNFQYIYQKNTGLGGARNTGLANAQGKYIFFLDSDDAVQKNSFQKLLSFAEERDADIVYFDELVCNDKLTVQSVAKTYQGMDIRILKLKALELSMHPSHIWARLYRRDLFDDISFTSIWYEDMEIFPQLLKKAKNLYYYKVPIYYYRQHKQGITYQAMDKRNLEVITAWRNVYMREDYSEEERRAVETCIKRSVAAFIFFRPHYASAYAEFYNQLFPGKKAMPSKRTCPDDIDIQSMPLWQQADFYGQTDILDMLAGLKDMYRYGGTLQFGRNRKVDFQKEAVQKELITFSSGSEIALMEMKLQRESPVVFEIIKDCSQWNLISLKNQMKEFKLAEIVIEKAILNGIRIEGRLPIP